MQYKWRNQVQQQRTLGGEELATPTYCKLLVNLATPTNWYGQSSNLPFLHC